MAKKNMANPAKVMKYFNDKDQAHVQRMSKGGSLNTPYETRGKVVTPAKNVGEVTQSPAPRKQPNVVVIKEKWNNK